MKRLKFILFFIIAILLVTSLYWTYDRSQNIDYVYLRNYQVFSIVETETTILTSEEVAEMCPNLELIGQTTLYVFTEMNRLIITNVKINVYGCSYIRLVRLRDIDYDIKVRE